MDQNRGPGAARVILQGKYNGLHATSGECEQTPFRIKGLWGVRWKEVCTYSLPEVDGIWGILGFWYDIGLFHILSM